MKQLNAEVNLVVCQKSKIADWLQHLSEQTSLAVYDLTKQKELTAFRESTSGGRVGVINYDLIWRRKDLQKLYNFTLLLDESSLIANVKAHRTRAILKMTPSNVILLPGTPTAGKYENLWSQLHLLGWNISLKAFEQNYVDWKKIEVGGFVHKIVDKVNPYKNVERMKSKMRAHGAVFMKTEEVHELPAQNIIEIKVKTTKEYRKFQKENIVTVTSEGCEYEAPKDDGDFWGSYEKPPLLTLVGDSTLSKRIYSRMLCGQYNADKLTAFRDLCESTNDRLLVFYNFNEELEALRKICAKLERPVSEINGHGKDLTAYHNESNSITLIQYKAGARGENLQKSNKIIYFSLTDEAELFMQSLKRIHRIGQERPCFYYILICENSIEDEEILPTLGVREWYTNEFFKK